MKISSNTKKVFFVLHVLFLCCLLAVSTLLAPYVVFLYDSPQAGGILLALFTVLWVSLPFVITLSLVLCAIFFKSRQKLAKRILFLPYVVMAMELVAGVLYFE
ncbi:MAG: hypothetical protein K0S20_388 [Patescibacteria group bacterium]|jgi:hypothetical protein|nr:hypothetical protein [Patescibacteria group bacterium]